MVSTFPTFGLPYSIDPELVPYAIKYLVTGLFAFIQVKVTLLSPFTVLVIIGALPGLVAVHAGATQPLLVVEVEVDEEGVE